MTSYVYQRMHRRDLCPRVSATEQAASLIPLLKGLSPLQHILKGGAEYSDFPSAATYPKQVWKGLVLSLFLL